MEEFHDWIAQKYVDWRGDKIGREGSVSAFAKWVDVTQSTMSYWLSGEKKPRSIQSINALVSRYGGEVYDVLGITPAEAIDFAMDSLTAALIDMIRQLTPEEKRMVRDQLHALAEKRGEYNIDDEERKAQNDQTKLD